MSTLTPWLVTLVVFQPVLSAVLVALLPQNEKRLVRAWTFLALLLNFGLTVLLYALFDPKGPEFSSSSASRGSRTRGSATTWASTVWRCR
jgi:NADH:ubiquinone oxidoreductase subunit 4 (subunit M)